MSKVQGRLPAAASPIHRKHRQGEEDAGAGVHFQGHGAESPLSDGIARHDQGEAATAIHLLPEIAGVDTTPVPVEHVARKHVHLLDLQEAASDAPSGAAGSDMYWRMGPLPCEGQSASREA